MGKIQKISALYRFVLSSLSVTKQISHHCTVFVIIRVKIPPEDAGLPFYRTLCDKYIQLLQQFLPRTINDEEQLEATQAQIDRLLDQNELSSEESDYLNVLGVLVFESKVLRLEKTERSETCSWSGNPTELPRSAWTSSIPDIYGIELLKFLIQERQLYIFCGINTINRSHIQ